VSFFVLTTDGYPMSRRGETLRLATRGSDLALRQAGTVREALATRRRDVELVEVETTGDQLRDELIHRLGKTGAFVRSLDEKILDGDLDGAVHSMKDVPTEGPEQLVLAGVPERGLAGDVLVTPDGTALANLPEGATVGTASLRRGAQLQAERPDLGIEPLRGNVDTRVEKLLAPGLQREHADRMVAERERKARAGDTDADGTDDGGDDPEADDTDDEVTDEQDVETWFEGLSEIERTALERDVDTEYDAIVLAEAGLDRLGLLHHVGYRRLDPVRFVPAPGQGAIAVAALDGPVAETIREVIDHRPTRVEATVERTVLATLGGGCIAPIGVHATLQGAVVRTTIRVCSRDGSEEVRDTRELPVDRHPTAAREIAESLRERGAADLIERATREARANEDASREAREDAGDAREERRE